MKIIWLRGLVLVVGALMVASCNQVLGIHRPVEAKDGGVVDAPLSDATKGTGNCVAGMPCIAANPCHEGETACSMNGATTCTDTQRAKAEGDLCGPGQVCHGGACQACVSGSDCPLVNKPCRVGTTSCATGVSVCVETDNQQDGSNCGAGMVCQAGMCTVCAAGAPCTPANPCHKGSLTCTGGAAACVDSGMVLGAGSPCGRDMVCGTTGVCAACIAASSCPITDNSCRTGMTVCNTGTPVCLESGNVTDGSACGIGNVCSGGVCVPCTAGLACTPANPCHGGKTVCSPAVSCSDTMSVINSGTSCGTDMVCSAGKCVACAAGKTCQPTDPCKVGTTSCATGVSACMASGNSPNGAGCGTGRVCLDGTCVACMAGTACTPMNPCHKGTQACDTGAGVVCTDTNMPVMDGTATGCGTNSVCRSGMCVTCAANQACQPTNVCKTGVTSCATGSSVCTESGNKPTGMNCSPVGMTGMVCSAGTCVPCVEGGTCKPANACHGGKLSCATGAPTCTDTATVLDDGTTCGPLPTSNLYCKAGVCSACTPGLACTTNPNPCKAGVTSCATGSSLCVDGGNKAAGSACGSSAATSCSGADTCDGMGACLPNNFAAGTDCGVCQQCNAAGACVAGYQGVADPTGCNGAGSTCSLADVCMNGACVLGNAMDGTDCGTCKQCVGGACVNGYDGAADPTGCNGTASTCSAADKCVAGACVLGNVADGLDCGTCKQCVGGACVNGYEGVADPSGCNGGVSPCSAADKCVAGACVLGNASDGTDCGVCAQCTGGVCGPGYQGQPDPTGCNGIASACSAADICNGGTCVLGNALDGTDCGVCKRCAAGSCLPGYEGGTDPSGCSAPQTCTANRKTSAQVCTAGACVSTPTNCPTGCTGNDCSPPRCGDAVINQTTETCDDGNTSNLDLCSTACKTCGGVVGPALTGINDDNSREFGLQFTATANVTIQSITVHTLGNAATVVLRRVDPAIAPPQRPILQMAAVNPGALDANGVTLPVDMVISVNWPLTAATTYSISQLRFGPGNGRFASVPVGTFPNLSAPGLRIDGGWDAGTANFDPVIFEHTVSTAWWDFTDIHTCLN